MDPALCHRRLFGSSPNSDQTALYLAYPKARGYADADLNEDRFTAVFVLAISQAMRHERVLFLAPVHHEPWFVVQSTLVMRRAFAHCKGMTGKSETRLGLARAYKKWLTRITFYGRLLQIPAEPKAWTAFGFTSDESIPEWVRTGLK